MNRRCVVGVRAEQRARTRDALLDEAERLFARQGYGAVGLPAVVAGAGVTKGALYHQFDGKVALFGAVLERVQARVAERVVEAARAEQDPWDRLVAGCRAFLDASTAPGTARVMLVDGPAVLGWPVWREIDERTSGRHLAEALAGLVGLGELEPQPVEPLARLLSGAMNELAMWLAGPGTTTADRAAARAALERTLDGLRRRG
ncbi:MULTISPECIES: TetR/AcrR family transcriptional regulator [unclassified Pseudonocardia]|uniref:TetR/AcrR family transcriptional regulator n=1 Tax=unclassified Pseudonocardia TaxID=2619320 RepID=UPI0020166C41|nr:MULTISPECIES: TetR/AcrR family transcriptional regulator [unclassified Pseudonocardia]